MMAAPENGAGFTARVISEFRGVPDGQTQVRTFAPGDTVSGELGKVAVAQGWAKALHGALENKAAEVGQSPFQTGPVKRSSLQQAGQAKEKKTLRGRKAKPE